MTVTAVGFSGPTFIQTPGNGAATVYTFPFLVSAAGDVIVGFIVGGTYTQQAPSTFAVAGIGNSGGGTVTFTVAPPFGTIVDIRSQIPETQPTNFANLGGYYPESTTNAVDRVTRLITDMYRFAYLFSIHGPDTENVPWTQLPGPAGRAGGGLVFDNNGLPTIGFLTSTNLTQALWDGFLNATTQLGPLIWGKTLAENTAGAAIVNLLFPTQPYDFRRYGQLANNAADDTVSVNTGILVAQELISGAQGNGVSFSQTGVSLLSSMVMLPNRCRILGVNKRGNYFQATNSWAIGNGVGAWNSSNVYASSTSYQGANLVTNGGILYQCKLANTNQAPPNTTYWNPISNAMFYAQNGYNAGVGKSMFDSAFENLSIDANNTAGLGCVLSSAWQEGCGLRNILLINFATYGIRFQDGFGGASNCSIEKAEIFGGTIAGTIGIDLSSPIGAVGGFKLSVTDAGIVGGSGGNLAAGISCKGNSLYCRNVHMETATTAFLLDGSGNITLDLCDGAPTVTTLVTVAATFTGTLVMINCRRNGATNFLVDNRAGGYGTITGTDHPLMIINGDTTESAKGLAFCSAWVTFEGSTAVIDASYNVTSVTRNSAGNYTLALTRAMQTASAAVSVVCNAATSGIQYRAQNVSASTLNVFVEVSGTPTDEAEIKVIIFGG